MPGAFRGAARTINMARDGMETSARQLAQAATDRAQLADTVLQVSEQVAAASTS